MLLQGKLCLDFFQSFRLKHPFRVKKWHVFFFMNLPLGDLVENECHNFRRLRQWRCEGLRSGGSSPRSTLHSCHMTRLGHVTTQPPHNATDEDAAKT